MNSEVLLRFNDTADAANTFLFPARGDYKSSGVVPSGIKSVFMGIRRAGKTSDLTSNHVAVMVNEGDTALPWERPDVTDAVGGGRL